ncbi:MAG: preprotein translocase subunit SecA [Candidatus Dormibacteria bacterium]
MQAVMSRLARILGDPIARELKHHRHTVERINALEDGMRDLSDVQLRAKTEEFRARLGVQGPDLTFGQTYSDGLSGDSAAGEERRRAAREERERRRDQLEELLPEAFAVVREAARRTLGMRHYDVQLVGGIVLHRGQIAEMRTGEGKTLVATLALYLNALEGQGAHLVTVNDYLARRDAGWNAPLYTALGMSVAVIVPGPVDNPDFGYIYDPDYLDETHPDPRLQHLRPCGRREAYAADITYATNNELGFDYLRDNMAPSIERCVQRRLHYAIVDEVDSILIDEARTPLIISGQGNEPTEKYYTYARLIPRLVPEEDYTVDEKSKSAALTDEGVEKIEQWTGISGIYDLEHVTEAHQINQALKAHTLYQRDRDYLVTADREVVIVDEFTGRTMPGRRWSDGLHQAIEAKEGVTVQQENVTLATITFQNFFRLYDKLAGMTGTALTESEEFDKIYKLEVVPIPTNRPTVRKDETDLIYKTEEAKYKAVAEEIIERHREGQPMLVGTVSIEKSERLSRLLEKRGIPHAVLNAKYHEQEAQIVAAAGQKGAVTIATNMAGRGTDIVLGEGVTDLGGLYIIGTERHESRRIDNQLRGRSGRQGDPGETRFFLSFEDDLMRVFGGERMQGIMERLRIEDDVPIENRMVSRQIEGAQSRVEGHNFDARRYVVEYDDVMNKQREIIYGERRKILEGTDTRGNLMAFLDQVVRAEVPAYCEGRHREDWDMEGLWERMRQIAPLPPVEEVNLDSLGDTIDEISETLIGECTAIYEELESKHSPELVRAVEQQLMLSVIDAKWRAYLTEMDHLREGINLQAYGQKDPLIEYKQAAFESFQGLTVDIQAEIVRLMLHVQINAVPQPAVEGGQPAAAAAEATAPRGGRADRGGGEMEEGMPPPARPAAAAASDALARATGARGGNGSSAPPRPQLSPLMPSLSSIVESSSAGSRPARVAGIPAHGHAGASPSRASAPTGGVAVGGNRKVGRNQPCPCGSGRKYKLCHGR